MLDARGAVIAVASEDGASFKRFQVAHGKAHGALSFNVGSRALGVMAAERPHFFAGAAHAVGEALIPVAGGVLIRNKENLVLGAVGVSGDTSDNDEAAPSPVLLQLDSLPTAANVPSSSQYSQAVPKRFPVVP